MNKNRQIIGELQEFLANNDASKASYLDKWEIDKRTIEDYGIVSEMKTERGDILLRCNNYQLHNDCKCVP